jgi:hypothetical protein
VVGSLLATPVQMIAVGGLLTLSAWFVIAMVLAVPLSTGRLLVRRVLSTQATKLSDFLPLSIVVVVLSALTLGMVKFGEAFPAICTRAAAVQHRRSVHVILCVISSAALFAVAFVIIPLGLGTILLRLVMPLKAHSVFQVPVVSLVMDCWCLGLVIAKVLWRLAHADVVLHSFHVELTAIWTEVQGSLTNFFFDLRAHCRIWRSIMFPVLEALALHLLLPRTVAHTLLRYCIHEGQEFIRAAILMYNYHVVLGFRLWLVLVPAARRWVRGTRQQIFDSKYLVSTELQNYHHPE